MIMVEPLSVHETSSRGRRMRGRYVPMKEEVTVTLRWWRSKERLAPNFQLAFSCHVVEIEIFDRDVEMWKNTKCCFLGSSSSSSSSKHAIFRRALIPDKGFSCVSPAILVGLTAQSMIRFHFFSLTHLSVRIADRFSP